MLTFGGASDGKSAFSSALLLGVICSIANPKMYSGTVSIIRVTKNVWRFCLRFNCEGVPMLLQKINRHCYVWHTKQAHNSSLAYKRQFVWVVPQLSLLSNVLI